MAAVLDMIAGREVAALLVNPQTPTAATDELQVAARRAGVPITELTETLPSGTDRDQFCAADRPDRRGRSPGLTMLTVVCLLVVTVLAICYRPLLFATVDPEVAAARGVPVRALGIVFAALMGVVAAQAVQIVGALLVMSLLITPAAAAAGSWLPRSPRSRPRWSSPRFPPSAASCCRWRLESRCRCSWPPSRL